MGCRLHDLIFTHHLVNQTPIPMMIYCEYLSRVKSLQLSINIHPKETLKMVLSTDSISIGSIKINLPCRVKPPTARITHQGKIIEYTVEVDQDIQVGRESTTSMPSEISCGACLNPLVDASVFKSASNLPSEYWHELLECWACHHEDYSKLKGQEGGRVLAKRSVIMNGNGYFLLDPLDLLDGVVELKYNGTEVKLFETFIFRARKQRRRTLQVKMCCRYKLPISNGVSNTSACTE